MLGDTEDIHVVRSCVPSAALLKDVVARACKHISVLCLLSTLVQEHSREFDASMAHNSQFAGATCPGSVELDDDAVSDWELVFFFGWRRVIEIAVIPRPM